MHHLLTRKEVKTRLTQGWYRNFEKHCKMTVRQMMRQGQPMKLRDRWMEAKYSTTHLVVLYIASSIQSFQKRARWECQQHEQTNLTDLVFVGQQKHAREVWICEKRTVKATTSKKRYIIWGVWKSGNMFESAVGIATIMTEIVLEEKGASVHKVKVKGASFILRFEPTWVQFL